MFSCACVCVCVHTHIHALKNKKISLARWLSGYRNYLLFQKSQIQLLSLILQLTIVYNSSSRGLDTMAKYQYMLNKNKYFFLKKQANKLGSPYPTTGYLQSNLKSVIGPYVKVISSGQESHTMHKSQFRGLPHGRAVCCLLY